MKKLGFSLKTKRFALLALLTLAGAVPAFSGTSFTPTGVIDMIPTSMSDDASIVVGTGIFGVPNLYYTEAHGASIIGEGCFSGLPAISGDGRTVLACERGAQGFWNAAKWLGGRNWLDLGTVAGGVPCDFFLSGAYGVNRDGSLGVGLLYLATLCKANAGTWDLVNGGPPTLLPALFGETTYTRANAVNADGSVIVGWQDQLTGERTAAKWVNGVEELILTQDGDFNGEALAVNANGGAIVGTNYGYGGHQAWIWRDGEGVSPIGRNAGDWVAVDVTDDGRVVVGFVRRRSTSDAFIWGKGSGAASLITYITNRGAVVPAGWTLNVASLISADGNTIYGWGINPDGLIEMYKVVLN
jgi:hypothetical protein